MIEKDKYIKLYASCIPLKGYCRSIICDTHFWGYQLIPNSLYDLLTKLPLKINEIYALYDKQEHLIIDEYIAHLENKDLIFFTNEPELYPALKVNYETPSIISNVILDINPNIPTRTQDICATIEELNQLHCEAILLRIVTSITQDALISILRLFDESTITAMDIQIAHVISLDKNDEYFELLVREFKRLKHIVVFSSIEFRHYQYSEVDLLFITDAIENFSCGEIKLKYFCFSTDTMMEAQCYNSCLNKKISIDEHGFIRNCPYTSKTFGVIGNVKLKEVINLTDFQSMWNIRKDSIDVCKDCEFRYVCSDCRVFIKDPNNIYSQPAKCTYNPYIAKWQGEDGYVPVEKCGIYSKTTGFMPNHDKIAQLNKTIWNENT